MRYNREPFCNRCYYYIGRPNQELNELEAMAMVFRICVFLAFASIYTLASNHLLFQLSKSLFSYRYNEGIQKCKMSIRTATYRLPSLSEFYVHFSGPDTRTDTNTRTGNVAHRSKEEKKNGKGEGGVWEGGKREEKMEDDMA